MLSTTDYAHLEKGSGRREEKLKKKIQQRMSLKWQNTCTITVFTGTLSQGIHSGLIQKTTKASLGMLKMDNSLYGAIGNTAISLSCLRAEPAHITMKRTFTLMIWRAAKMVRGQPQDAERLKQAPGSRLGSHLGQKSTQLDGRHRNEQLTATVQ